MKGQERKARRSRTLALSALILAAGAACGGSDTTPTQPDLPTQPETPVATTVTLSTSSLSFASLGETARITSSVQDQNGQTMAGASVSWTSSAPTVAGVSSTGLVTAGANGTATLTATSGAASATASATVQQRAASVSVSPSTVSLEAVGESAQLSATVQDAGGSDVEGATVAWASSDATVADVSPTGLVTAVANGSAAITATAGTVVGSATADVKLQVTTHEANKVSIPVGGNAWVDDPLAWVAEDGVNGWSTTGSVVQTYFRVDQAGSLIVSVSMVGPGAESVVTLGVGESTRTLRVSGTAEQEFMAGEFQVAGPGYVAVELTGVSTEGVTFGRPVTLHVSGGAVTSTMSFVPNNDGNMFYFGRRGPSTHLRWAQPAGTNVQWMYSEVTAPEGEDVTGTYFMANGFDAGYFGMQVNGPEQRQFLFSIWSPFETDDPSSIPDEYKITLNRKGDEVIIGEFGNEGSGGQSRLEHMWTAGTTYRFVTEIRPNGDGSTDFTGWVDIPEAGGWQLIASFRRPFTDAYATGMYSFLENFLPDQGAITRYGRYQNQWVADENGVWQEILDLTFTTDGTGEQGFRKDFAGGLMDGVPFMKMGGFFDEWVAPWSTFTRTPSSGPPDVDLSALP